VNEAELVETLRRAFGGETDARTACIDERTQPIGIWLRGGSERDNAPRERGLRQA